MLVTVMFKIIHIYYIHVLSNIQSLTIYKVPSNSLISKKKKVHLFMQGPEEQIIATWREEQKQKIPRVVLF